MLGRQWRTDRANDTKVGLVGTSSNEQLEDGKTIAKQRVLRISVNVL